MVTAPALATMKRRASQFRHDSAPTAIRIASTNAAPDV